VIVFLKINVLIDLGRVQRSAGDGLGSVDQRSLIFIVILLTLLLEGGIRVNIGSVLYPWRIADVGSAEDIAVLSSVHLKVTVRNNN
jgi:hypothetical protein